MDTADYHAIARVASGNDDQNGGDSEHPVKEICFRIRKCEASWIAAMRRRRLLFHAGLRIQDRPGAAR